MVCQSVVEKLFLAVKFTVDDFATQILKQMI